VKNKILATIAILVAVWACVSIRNSFAQTTGEVHGWRDHTKSDGAFHRRFQDAEKWAKEFDDPERDTWQKPQEILDALHLEQNSTLADVGAGTGYSSVRIAKRIPRTARRQPTASLSSCSRARKPQKRIGKTKSTLGLTKGDRNTLTCAPSALKAIKPYLIQSIFEMDS
jgi:cyclopropane fatty-acyl-phospholipid synthase-like methyltransferase